tara:strand:+ start:10164 stop:11630 length:1467 start_codon:yes stop_codon:yes gene_type:complete
MKISVKYSVLFGLILFSFSAIAAPNKATNIILILADDVSPDKFGLYKQAAAVLTPNIDKLAHQGVAFKTAYATAMCGPSRVQLMTGKYANSTGVYHNSIWLENSHNNVYSNFDNFAIALKKQGYASAITGKWHAGNQMPYEKELAFDEYALWVNDKHAHDMGDKTVFNGAYEDQKTPSRYWHPSYAVNGKRLKTKPTDFSLDIEVDFINDFIKRQSKENKPFLVYWPTVAPHGARKGMPTTPHRGDVGEMGKTNKKETAARFDALIEYLDYSVGQVIKNLEELGELDNTVIIFVSDNGTAVTAKTRGVERGPQVAAIMSGAGIKSRGLSNELTDFTDIAPTIVDIASQGRSKVRYDFDGTSLYAYLQGETDVHRDWIYGYISGSQIFRTKTHLLEVVNPMLGLPDGRLYSTGDNRFQQGYQRLKETDINYSKAMGEFTPLLQKFSALSKEHPYFSTKKGKKFVKEYLRSKSKNKHLYNHKDYKFYDES